jgi:hypothetical protein
VCTLAEGLLKLGYITELDNYYSSPELFDILNNPDTDAARTIKTQQKITA